MISSLNANRFNASAPGAGYRRKKADAVWSPYFSARQPVSVRRGAEFGPTVREAVKNLVGGMAHG